MWKRSCRGQGQKQGWEAVAVIQVSDHGSLAQVAAVEGMGSGQVPGGPHGFWLEQAKRELSLTEAGKTEGLRVLAGLGLRCLPDV